MTHLNRDLSILQHMVDYCNQIDETVAHFGNAYDTFANSAVYRNATALCILQIGELVGKLTEEFKTQHPAIPWKQIKAMRNIVAHSYGTVDPETTWEIIIDDIPSLRRFCCSIINSEGSYGR
ncbi:DUF86 domain-containing protein [Bengtsoniella intestinalis]|uniref:HepT-like ribonuclease domain-containing protein n=1 Tax=Bengtsoniella intestinalis TaxID=3073143 RepID=UPI00391EE3A7